MSMISNRVLEDLLQEPLGPYHDRDILHETTCQMKGPTKLVLYSFILEHDGQVIGLDESEHPLEGEDNRKFRFRGVLKIADPDWLSEFGVKMVETELNLRAKQHVLRLGEPRRTPQLTLDYLFQKHFTKSRDATHKDGETTLTVLIQGEENMPAVYMRSSNAPTGLLWSSKAHNRKYKIATMDAESYSLSENFFWRWRLFALMEKLCKLYPHDSPRQRTPRWFVERYMMRFACPPEDGHRRLIFDEDDSDMDDTGKTETPRHLLKPHMSEILGLFAAQAEWFITNNVVKREALFDISSWYNFAKEVRKQRKEASRQGVKWGWPAGQGEEFSTSENEDDEDDDGFDRVVKENPVIGKSNEILARKIELAQARSNRGAKRATSISSDSAGEDAPGGVEYVSDFSVPSDAEESDSDYRAVEEEARDRIPWQLQVPPLLPDVDGRWWCPLQECGYLIDLHDLTEEQGRGVPDEFIAHILQKRWNNDNAAYDGKILQGFRCMVTNHYMKHFEECGVKAERREGKMRLTLIEGRRRRNSNDGSIQGPMPVRGTLGGESRVVPIVHTPQAEDFQ